MEVNTFWCQKWLLVMNELCKMGEHTAGLQCIKNTTKHTVLRKMGEIWKTLENIWLIERCNKDGSNWEEGLQQMRATPISKDISNPLRFFMEDHIVQGMDKHQQTQSTTRTSEANCYNARNDSDNSTTEDMEWRNCHHFIFNRMYSFSTRMETAWEPATITQVGPEPRSCPNCTLLLKTALCCLKPHLATQTALCCAKLHFAIKKNKIIE